VDASIRQLTEGDWQALSSIRLRALQTDPSVFASSYEVESKFCESDWQKWFDPENTALFIIFDDEKPVGMTAISVYRDDPTNKTAILWGSWLEPSVRRRGLSKMMYEYRIAWAKAHPTVEKIIVSHRASNLSSRYANQKHGFLLTDITEKVWPDGIRDKELHYELRPS